MKMSLSVRVAEAFHDKEKATRNIDEIIGLAESNGYDALCMRASQAGVHSPADRITELQRKIVAAGLEVSMITGDFAIPSNNDQGPQALRRIGPYLDLADRFGAKLIRVCMKKDEDIPWARRAADEARERQIRLVHQSHCASLFETVEGSLRVLKSVNRPNFGLIYEPANWFIAGEPYGRATVKRLRSHIFNFYIQNHRLNPAAKDGVETWKRGRVTLDHIGVWEMGGIDAADVFEGLRENGYSGFVTVHQAFGDLMPVEESVRKSYQFLKPLTLRS
jgi:sugar phosphate isomerase/epimerase